VNRFVTALAVLSIVAGGPALAKHHASPAAQTAQADATNAASDQNQAKPAPSDLTGQKVYTSTNNLVGTVASMSKDADGKPAAVIGVEKRLGIGSQKVLLSVSQLQPRDNGGGYYTNMTLAQVRTLPKAP